MSEERKTYTIDAGGKRLGRVATEVAHVLLGKNVPSFEKHTVTNVSVVVTHADDLYIDEKKKEQVHYVHYTGHPGGKRETPLGKVLVEKGSAEILRRAVYGMLPANKLRKERLRRLTIEK